ncbi:MAG: response regulator [Elusimicrobia bacterium]|nr:response regulator [Elusimicrobiota bacterium]
MHLKNYSTIEIAQLINVAYKTVGRWIDDGELEAFKTPGGHRRVYAENLVVFLRKHNMKIPSEIDGSAVKNILIVDDDETVRKSIEKAIRKKIKNSDVHTASDGFRAGQAVSDHNPDVVILDLKLPGLDGFEVCRIIKERDRNKKIIAITGYDTPENRRKILKAGADDYIVKPFDAEDIVESIKKLVRVD